MLFPPNASLNLLPVLQYCFSFDVHKSERQNFGCIFELFVSVKGFGFLVSIDVLATALQLKCFRLGFTVQDELK